MNPAEISISDYTYDLPADRIAFHPLEQRDASKLLIYQDGEISETIFSEIAGHLPEQALLVKNNTRVINARILFKKSTGANIEIFCLEPRGAVREYSSVMSATANSEWKCLVGGAARWKEEALQKQILVDEEPVILKAVMLERLPDSYSILFTWLPAHHSFASIIEAAGDTPLPPYIKRGSEETDVSRYQTIFAKQEGSVAAPTAGLHFTETVFEKLKAKNTEQLEVTLHVGAGTFKPVKAATMHEHEMHAEYIDVSLTSVEKLKNHTGPVAAIGTTSCRTIESLYWMGVKAMLDPETKNLAIQQWDIYEKPLAETDVTKQAALDALIEWMRKNNQANIFTQTQLMIAPGYEFRIADILITNFHQPQSTLLLLVAAAIGNNWRKMYDYAMKNNFRFLSYGDANLIFIDKKTG